MRLLYIAFLCAVGCIFAAEKEDAPAQPLPKQLEDVGITEHRDQMLPLETQFLDETRQVVTLSRYFDGKKPVVLALVYLRCPMLCNLILNGEAESMREIALTAGKDYECVVISFDPIETPELAAANRQRFLDIYQRSGGGAGVHFLTGNKENIEKVTKAVGFAYKWDAEQKVYAHQAAIYVVTPEGRLSRYLYGVQFPSQTLRLSLLDAAAGKIGSVRDQFVLFCYHFDPSTNQYSLQATRLMQIGGALTVLVLGGMLGLFFLREARHRRQAAAKGNQGPGKTGETPKT